MQYKQRFALIRGRARCEQQTNVQMAAQTVLRQEGQALETDVVLTIFVQEGERPDSIADLLSASSEKRRPRAGRAITFHDSINRLCAARAGDVRGRT